jgi:hypothetical protein
MSKKLVHGLGVYEKGEYTCKVGGRHTKEYRLWQNMLRRCYSQAFQEKSWTYKGCSVSEEFKYFQKFSEWCNSQIGFGIKGYQLDKDIIYKGNKQYNRDSCAFVPKQLNTLLGNSGAIRGDYPVGVGWHKTTERFQSSLAKMGKSVHIGLFSTPEDAFYAYKEAKEAYIKVVAEKYKDSIDPRVYQALMEWEVHTDD